MKLDVFSSTLTIALLLESSKTILLYSNITLIFRQAQSPHGFRQAQSPRGFRQAQSTRGFRQAQSPRGLIQLFFAEEC